MYLFLALMAGYAGPQDMLVKLVCWLDMLAMLPGGISGWLLMLYWIYLGD